MPRFHVRDTFALSDQSTFVLAGFAIEGEIAVGMLVNIPFSPVVIVTAPIDHIEVARRRDGEVNALCITCPEPGQLKLWESFKIQDRIIEITPAAWPQTP